MLPQGLELAGAALCQLACVATLQIHASHCVCPSQSRWTQDTIIAKNTWIFILKSGGKTSQHPCALGSPASPASHTLPPQLRVGQCWLRTHCSSFCFLCHQYRGFSPFLTAEDVVPVYFYEVCIHQHPFCEIHSSTCMIFIRLGRKTGRKITYFVQLKYVLSKILLSWSVKYFIRTRKPFHTMLYTLILIYCFTSLFYFSCLH